VMAYIPIGAVVVDYVNWRGEQSTRTIVPERLLFESTKWHPEKQWILWALDVEKGERRGFAMRDVKSWRSASKREGAT
jgi:hypothetical protein